jgi:hypothetical protein
MQGLEFDGATFDARLDSARLTGQLLAVHQTMKDGQWRTLSEILAIIGSGAESSVSARLRDLRKAKFGGYRVERRRRGSGGTWEYRVEEGAHGN